MAQIILTIPDERLTDFRNHAAAGWGYKNQVPGPNKTMVANPETKAVFIQRMLRQILKAATIRGAREVAEKAAGDTAQASADLISIT